MKAIVIVVLAFAAGTGLGYRLTAFPTSPRLAVLIPGGADARKVASSDWGPGVVLAVTENESNPANLGADWMLCDGRDVDASTYPDLAKAIVSSKGSNMQSAPLRLPDFRGLVMSKDGPAPHADAEIAENLSLGHGDAQTSSNWTLNFYVRTKMPH